MNRSTHTLEEASVVFAAILRVVLARPRRGSVVWVAWHPFWDGWDPWGTIGIASRMPFRILHTSTTQAFFWLKPTGVAQDFWMDQNLESFQSSEL